MLKICSLKYFKAFSNKDINSIDSMLASNVRLKDWDISVKGKESVLQAMHNIFDSVDSIKVTVLEMYQEEYSIASELDILINNKELIKVVDILEFNESNKILRIRAFKC